MADETHQNDPVEELSERLRVSRALMEKEFINCYANDAEAAAFGVEVGQIYRNGPYFMVRST